MKYSNEIKIEKIDETTYYKTIAKGIDFLIYKNNNGWNVGSSRVALGGLRKNPGTWRIFDTVDEIGNSIKSLKNISLMIH